MTFKTRRLKEDTPPPKWLLWTTKALSLGLRLHKPMLAWYADFKKRTEEQKREEKRFRMLKKMLMILCIVLMFVLVIAGTVKALTSMRILTLGNVFSVAGSDLPTDANGYTNLLLLGRGDRGHDGQDLTDSMMIVSLDPRRSKSVVMVSIPRDLYITSPVKLTSGRVNTLFRDAKGWIKAEEGLSDAEASPKALALTAEEVGAQFGVEIHRTVMVNFSAFTELVDAVGGLDIIVPNDLVDSEYPNANENGYELFVLRAGPQHIDGETALKYVRSRHSTSDFDRSARQQQVLHALAEKMRESGWLRNPTKLLDLWRIASSNTETNMTMGELLGLAGIGERIERTNVLSIQLSDRTFLPGGFLYSPPREEFGGASVLLPTSYADLRTFIGFTTQNRESLLARPEVAIRNAGARPGTAGLLRDELSRFLLPIISVGNTEKEDQRETSVIVARTDREKEVADWLGKLLKMPVEVAEKEAVEVTSDGTVVVAGESEETPAQVTIFLGKDYVFESMPALLKPVEESSSSN